MKNGIAVLILTAALGLTLLSGCAWVAPPAADNSGRADLLVNLSVPGGRTLSPIILDKVKVFRVEAQNTSTGALFVAERPFDYYNSVASGAGRTASIDLSLQLMGLTYGNYVITGRAYGDAEKLELLLEGSRTLNAPDDITSASNDSSIDLDLSPVGTGGGSLKFSLAFPWDTQGMPMVTSWEGTLQTLPDLDTVGSPFTGVPDDDSVSLIEIDPLTAGSYLLTLRLKNGALTYPEPWMETVVILPGMSTPGEGRDYIYISSSQLTETPPQVEFLAAAPILSGTNTRVQLIWGDVSDQEMGYRIYRSVNGAASTTHTVASNTLSWVDEGVTSGNNYVYRVAAFTAAGEGPSSSAVSYGFSSGPLVRAVLESSSGKTSVLAPGISPDMAALLETELVAGERYPLTLRISNVGSAGSTLTVNSFNAALTSGGYLEGSSAGFNLNQGQSTAVPLEFVAQAVGTLTGADLALVTNNGNHSWSLYGDVRAPLIYYVDSAYGDWNDGLSPAFALRTIGKGVSLAYQGDTVRVRDQSFTEALVLDRKVRIEGGWNSFYDPEPSGVTELYSSPGATLVVESGSAYMDHFYLPGHYDASTNATVEVKKGASLEMVSSTIGSTGGSNDTELARSIQVSGGILTLKDSTVNIWIVGPASRNATALILESQDGVKGQYTGNNVQWTTAAINNNDSVRFVELRGEVDFTSTGGSMIMSATHQNSVLILDSTAHPGIKTLEISGMYLEQGSASQGAESLVSSGFIDLRGATASSLILDGNELYYSAISAAPSARLLRLSNSYTNLITNNLVHTASTSAGIMQGLALTDQSGAAATKVYNNTFYLQGSWTFTEIMGTGLDVRNNIILGNGAGNLINQNPYKVKNFVSNAVNGFTNVKISTPLNGTNLNLTDLVVSASTVDVNGNFKGDPGISLTDDDDDGRPDLIPQPSRGAGQMVFGGQVLTTDVPTDYNGADRTQESHYSIGAFHVAASHNSNTSPLLGNFQYVPSGRYQRDADGGNVNVITQGFRMPLYEVTRAQFQTVMGQDPSNTGASSGNSDPVQQVNWYHAIAFSNKLSVAEGFTPVYSIVGISDWEALTFASIPTTTDATWDAATADWTADGYRLPTESEWMWAAMGAPSGGQGGSTDTAGYLKAFAGSTGSNAVGDYAWHNGNSGGKTQPVGTKSANESGLFDMSGNVFEWCWDWNAALPGGNLTDYRGAGSGSTRLSRGGSWAYDTSYTGVAVRNGSAPFTSTDSGLGFRVVRY